MEKESIDFEKVKPIIAELFCFLKKFTLSEREVITRVLYNLVRKTRSLKEGDQDIIDFMSEMKEDKDIEKAVKDYGKTLKKRVSLEGLDDSDLASEEKLDILLRMLEKDIC